METRICLLWIRFTLENVTYISKQFAWKLSVPVFGKLTHWAQRQGTELEAELGVTRGAERTGRDFFGFYRAEQWDQGRQQKWSVSHRNPGKGPLGLDLGSVWAMGMPPLLPYYSAASHLARKWKHLASGRWQNPALSTITMIPRKSPNLLRLCNMGVK